MQYRSVYLHSFAMKMYGACLRRIRYYDYALYRHLNSFIRILHMMIFTFINNITKNLIEKELMDER